MTREPSRTEGGVERSDICASLRSDSYRELSRTHSGDCQERVPQPPGVTPHQQQPILICPSGVTGGPNASFGGGAPLRTAIQRRIESNNTRMTPMMNTVIKIVSR